MENIIDEMMDINWNNNSGFYNVYYAYCNNGKAFKNEKEI